MELEEVLSCMFLPVRRLVRGTTWEGVLALCCWKKGTCGCGGATSAPKLASDRWRTDMSAYCLKVPIPPRTVPYGDGHECRVELRADRRLKRVVSLTTPYCPEYPPREPRLGKP
eukprot:2121544-Amphidinium_carterae.1